MNAARRALISVSDKTGIAQFARGMVATGFEILSTGGTSHFLKQQTNCPMSGSSAKATSASTADSRCPAAMEAAVLVTTGGRRA